MIKSVAMIQLKRSISFVAEACAGNADTARVRCVVTWAGKRLRFGTGCVVNVRYWESALQRCRVRTYHGHTRLPAATINRRLDDMEELLTGIFRSFEAMEVVPTKEEYMAEYDKRSKPERGEREQAFQRSVFPAYDEFVKDGTRSARWSKGSLVKANTIRRHLFKMSPTLTFEELDEDGVSRLIEYFSTVPDNEKAQGLCNTSIRNDIAFVKVFVRWAQEHGYCHCDRFINQRVRLKTAVKPVIFLTWDELMHVYDYNFGTKQYLAHVRDVFCFCCFTSLRYSDVRNLRRHNICDGEIHITTVKTHDSLVIELNKYSRAILDKYADINLPNGAALPVITNQKMNNYLKEMGQLCSLDAPVVVTRYKGNSRQDCAFKKWELLSTHCGRRTFVCNALMLGIPPDIVMKWTGHSDYKTMKPYIAIADEARRRAMTAFDTADSTLATGQTPKDKRGK